MHSIRDTSDLSSKMDAIGGGLKAATRRFVGAVQDDWQMYSDNASDYTVGAPIGFGASSTVYLAHYQPNDKSPVPCALKVLDLDVLAPRSLNLLVRETQLMSLSKHPNVLRVRGSWTEGHKLYIAMRLMNRGSAADIMRYGWPGGMEEEVVRCILRQALEGLNYLHINGFIHRDVKAANLLIDDDGTVLLGDLGVAASLVDEDSFLSKEPVRRPMNFDLAGPVGGTQRSSEPARRPINRGKRKSFVGTPCWMAPEVIDGKQYDASADIWSFGITALELTQGRAPGSREPSHKVLLRTVQEAPPEFDREGGAYKYSRAFKDVVETCLCKDPSKRPTAMDLLQTPFFKGAKKKNYLVGAILNGLPPLVDRQERYRQPSDQLRGTIDSWDFSQSFPTSPTESVYHKRPMSIKLPEDGVFNIDDIDGQNDTAPHVRYGSTSRTQTKSPSDPEPEPQPIYDSPSPSPSPLSVSPRTSESLPRNTKPSFIPNAPAFSASLDIPQSVSLSSSPGTNSSPASSLRSASGGVWRKLTRRKGIGETG